MGAVVSKPTIELFLRCLFYGCFLNCVLCFPSGVWAPQSARSGHRPGLDPSGRRDHVCGSEPDGRGGPAHPHGAAGGRHEGVGSPGHQLAAQQRQEIPAHQRWGSRATAGQLQPYSSVVAVQHIVTLLSNGASYSLWKYFKYRLNRERVSAISATVRMRSAPQCLCVVLSQLLPSQGGCGLAEHELCLPAVAWKVVDSFSAKVLLLGCGRHCLWLIVTLKLSRSTFMMETDMEVCSFS